jgi:hypothetical protein
MHGIPDHSFLTGEKLRQLPCGLAPPLTWAEFEPRLAPRVREPQRMWGLAAIAAGVTALVVGLAVWGRVGPLNSTQPPRVASTQTAPAMLAPPDQRFIEQAQASEAWLRSLPAEPAVMRVSTRGAVTDLEDHIAWVDDALSDESLDVVNPTRLLALQQERARLVNSLAQVRYAETLAAGMP